MEIAKGIYNSDYIELNLESLDSPDWDSAIKIFEKRIFERYIEPIDKLIELEQNTSSINKKYGFIILATDCMILETLQCFYEGKEDSNRMSERIFINFLTQRGNFKNHFNKNIASNFFKNFRCGILHQLETYKNSKIWSVGKMVNINENGMTINRTEFHNSIKKEVLIYINLLKESTHLRQNFKTKMDYICQKKII